MLRPKVDPTLRIPAKGERGGECARTVCTTRPATSFNRSTNGFYCVACGDLINDGLSAAQRAELERMYGSPEICTLDAPEAFTR